MQPERIVKMYKKSIGGILTRKFTENGLMKRGYVLLEEEEIKKYSGGKGCLLAIVFLPLALLGGKKYVKCTYGKN